MRWLVIDGSSDAGDRLEQGPSRYRHLPTLDAGGGVRWDPMSNTAEVRVLSTAPIGNAMREMVAVRSAPGSRP